MLCAKQSRIVVSLWWTESLSVRKCPFLFPGTLLALKSPFSETSTVSVARCVRVCTPSRRVYVTAHILLPAFLSFVQPAVGFCVPVQPGIVEERVSVHSVTAKVPGVKPRLTIYCCFILPIVFFLLLNVYFLSHGSLVSSLDVLLFL